MKNLDQLIDKAYNGKSAEELLKAPVSALKGVSKADEKQLFTALGIRTIGDLASHWSVQRAQAIVLSKDLPGTTLQAHGVTLAEPATPDPVPDPWAEKVEKLLKKDDSQQSLKTAWINLQVYCYYGLKLPTDRESLKHYLKTENLDLLSEPIIKGVTENYSKVRANAEDFLNNTYNNIVALGTELKEFADDGKMTTEGSIFQAILNLLVENDRASALDLLKDRITEAEKNSTAAGDILTKLAIFKTNLTESSVSLGSLKAIIDADENVSMAAIAKLSGDENMDGSIKNLQKKLADAQAEYKHDVIVASTSPTYAWIFPWFPIGLVAAAVVSGVFSKQAIDDLKEIAKEKELKTKAEKDLNTAKLTNALQGLAETSVDKTIIFTNTAIACTTELQNAWSMLSGDLNVIKESFEKTVSLDANSDAALKANVVVKAWVNKSKEKWTNLSPIIDTLMTNAYITVSPNDMTMEDFIKTLPNT